MGKLLRDYSEKELIRWLFSDEGLIFTSFAFMFREACGFQIADWELEFWFNLDRKEVGLDPQGKPGDIDVLIVPKFKGDRFVERAMAIEVKKLFASREKPQRSPNAYGTSQVKGLFADGFPFVGLLHMVLVEASHPKHFFAVPVIIGVNRKGEYVYGKSIRTDPAGFDIANRHNGRLLKIDMPYFSGYKVQVFQLSARGERFVSMNANDSRAPIRNPEASESLLSALRKLELVPDCSVRFTYGGSEIRRKPYFSEEENLTPLIDEDIASELSHKSNDHPVKN